MELKESKTWNNLHAAFAGESQARAKYTYFTNKARKQGYEQIASIFEETAKNESAHSKIWYEMITGGVGDTEENLKIGQEGERYEWSEMYAEFARVAREEGFENIAAKFEQVAKIEKMHDERYTQLLENMQAGQIFSRPQEEHWICGNCGYVHVGKNAPGVCPVCTHPQGYFYLKAENY